MKLILIDDLFFHKKLKSIFSTLRFHEVKNLLTTFFSSLRFCKIKKKPTDRFAKNKVDRWGKKPTDQFRNFRFNRWAKISSDRFVNLNSYRWDKKRKLFFLLKVILKVCNNIKNKPCLKPLKTTYFVFFYESFDFPSFLETNLFI